MNKEQMIAWANSRIHTATSSLEGFAAKLIAEPEHAVEWSYSMYSDTGNLHVAKFVLNLAEGDCPFENVIENLEVYVIDGAIRSGVSSNPTATMLNREKLRAYGDALRTFKQRQQHQQERAAEATPAEAKA